MYNDDENRRMVLQGREALERTSASLARSNQLAVETEQIGTEIISELGEQRESLLRSQRGLSNTNDSLSKSQRVLRTMKRNVLYNKLVLILIIVCEVGILSGLIYLKFIHNVIVVYATVGNEALFRRGPKL